MKTAVKISGLAYLLIFISGFYANFAILETLIDLGKSEETTFNIIRNLTQFRNGLFGFLVMLVSDVILIWSLFKITKPVHKSISYITSLFRGLHAFFFTIALVKLYKVYVITSEATNSLEIHTDVINLLRNFDKLWTIGLLFFSVHLLLLGFLSCKSKYIPSFIGYLLMLAALGYFSDGLSKLYFTNYSDYQYYFEAIVILTAVVGELSFTIWLLIKGFSRKKFSV